MKEPAGPVGKKVGDGTGTGVAPDGNSGSGSKVPTGGSCSGDALLVGTSAAPLLGTGLLGRPDVGTGDAGRVVLVGPLEDEPGAVPVEGPETGVAKPVLGDATILGSGAGVEETGGLARMG